MAENKVPLFIRGIHWALALVFLLNGFVLPHGDGPHRLLGFAGVALVATRLLLMMKTQLTYFNPRAIVVYALMWASIFGLGITGWMTQLDAFWGNSTVRQVHAVFAYVLTFLVVVHLAGVFIDALRHKRKTWLKMMTGE